MITCFSPNDVQNLNTYILNNREQDTLTNNAIDNEKSWQEI